MNYLKKGFRELLGGDKGSVSSSSTSRDASSSSAETAAISSPRAPEPLPLRAVVPHEPCAASLPDVAFDEKDERDAHVLFLWSVLEGAPAGSPNREDALESFLDGFAEAFDGWRPVSGGEEDATLLRAPATASTSGGDGGGDDDGAAEAAAEKKPVVMGCARGHPVRVLGALVDGVVSTQKTLDATLGQGAHGAAMRADEPALRRAAGVSLLRALGIATRSKRNRIVLRERGLLPELTKLLKSAMQRLNTLAALAGMREPGGSGGASMGVGAEVQTQLGVLESLCELGAEVLANYLRPDGAAAAASAAAAAAAASAASAAPPTSKESPAVKPLLECGGFTAMIEMIRIQRTLRARPTGSDRAAAALEASLLDSLSAALSASSSLQNSLRGAGGLEVLIEGIGDSLGQGGRVASEGESDAATSSGVDAFALQVKALRAVRAAVRRNGVNVRHATAAGAFGGRLSSLLRDAATESARVLVLAGDNGASAPDDAALAAESPPGEALATVFELLSGFVDADVGGGYGAATASSSGVDLAAGATTMLTHVVHAAVDALKHEERPGSLASALLHAHVARFTRALLHAYPSPAVNACRDAGAWTVLLSSDVAHGRAPATATPPLSASVDGDAASESPEAKAKSAGDRSAAVVDDDASSWSIALKTSTLAIDAWFFAASVAGERGGHLAAASTSDHGGGGSEPEVSAMLDAIAARATQPRAASSLAAALTTTLSLAPRGTSVALLRAGAPSKLGAAAAAQVMLWGIHPAETDAAAEKEAASDAVAAQASVLSLLVSVLERGGAALGAAALTAPELVDLLFRLLWSPTARDLALKSIAALIASRYLPGGVPGNTHASAGEADAAWEATLRRYLETLPAAREIAAGRGPAVARGQGTAPLGSILSSLRAALDGPGGGALRAYIAGDSRGEAYVQVVSLLNGEGVDDERVILDVLITLRSLLSGSEAAAAAFGDRVGYDTFAHALRAAWGDAPVTRTLLLRTLDLAVDGDFPDDENENENENDDAPAENPVSPGGGGGGGVNPTWTAGQVIRNPGALSVLVSLLRVGRTGANAKGHGADVGWVLKALAKTLGESVASRAAADQADLLGELLDWFYVAARASTSDETDATCELLSDCIGWCASHSLSARHFRFVFKMLRDPSVGVTPRRMLLRTLRVAAKRDGPSAFFDFAGEDGIRNGVGGDASGTAGALALTQPPPWPSGRGGYTFAAWMRVESFPVSGRGVALFALRTASGLGVAATLRPSGVDISTFSSASSGSAAKAEAARIHASLPSKRWMFVVITHTPGRPPLFAATVKVYVDGEMVGSSKLRFPKVTEPLTACCVGAFNDFDAAAMAAAAAAANTSSTLIAKGAAAAAAVGSAPFRGQLGAVRLFDDVLSHAAVEAMTALGSDYLGSFSPAETASGLALAGVGMSASEAKEVRENIAPRLVLSLNAAAASGRTCYSTVGAEGGGAWAWLGAVKDRIAAAVDTVRRRGDEDPPGGDRDLFIEDDAPNVAAMIVGAARVCATHSAKDIIHCLGGVRVLFPLLAPRDDDGAPRSREEDAHDAAIAADAIDLLASLLDGSRLNQEALRVSGGHALIAHLLRSDGGRRLSPALIPAMERLARAASSAWGSYGIDHVDHDQPAVRLLLDMRLWQGPHVDPEALSAHSALLRALAQRDPGALRAMLPPTTLVDAAGDLRGHDRDENAVRSRRRALLAVAGSLLPGAVYAAYVDMASAAVFAIEEAGESAEGAGAAAAGAAAADILEGLVELLQPGVPAQRSLANAIASECGGTAVVLAPLSRPHAETRALAIRLLAALLPRTDGFESGGGLRSANTGGGVTDGTLDAPDGLWSAVTQSLLIYPLTHEIRAALFELMLGGQPVPALETPAPRKASGGMLSKGAKMAKAAGGGVKRFFGGTSSSSFSSSSSAASATSSQGPQGMGGSSLVHQNGGSSSGVPGVVHPAAAGLLLQLLEGCADTEMRSGVLELLLRLVEGAPANAHALVGRDGWQSWLLPVMRRDPEGASDAAAAARGEERALAMRLMRALHAHAVLRVDEGHVAVEATVAAVAASADRGGFDGDALSRLILGDLMEALLEQDPGAAGEGDRATGGGAGGAGGGGKAESWTFVDRPGLAASPCGDNLHALLPLVDAAVAEASPAAALEKSQNVDGASSGLDGDTWRMFDGTWKILETLVRALVTSTGTESRGHSRTPSMSGDVDVAGPAEDAHGDIPAGGDRGGGAGTKKYAAQRVATMQRVAFRLVIVYVYEAPTEAANVAANALEAMLPSLLAPPGGSGSADADRASTSNRLHLFLAALVRAETAFTASSPERAKIAERLVAAAAGAAKGLLGGGLLQGGVVGGGGSGARAVDESQAGAVAAAVMTAAAPGAVGGGLRGLISEQKAAAAAAEEAKEARRFGEQRRAAAAAAAVRSIHWSPYDRVRVVNADP